MRRQIVGVMALIILGTSMSLAGDAATGKIVYDKKCRICHGDNGEGNPDVAKKLKAEQKPLWSEEVQKMSDADFKKLISEGKGKMKPPKNVSEEDIENVIAFVRTIKKP
ncbi:MAG TPA: cytochrome c [Terriglobales bacterium]|nr:cytochrome c [Terriglobales bacterium]